MRRGHWLKQNAHVELPQRMVFVDTESHITPIDAKHEKHTLWFGTAIYIRVRREKGKEWAHEERFTFTTAQGFWRWLVSKSVERGKTHVYAHNWNYDAGILQLATLPREDGWESTRYINDKPPFIFTLRKGNTTLAFVDSLNYFSSSLKILGDSIGSPKLPMPCKDAPFNEWVEYNLQDTMVIRDAIMAFRAFVKENDLGNWQNTLAGQAFTAFRHRFMTSQILIHDDVKVCRLEREAYYGGRTEAFFLGTVEGPIYYLDVNSMYPYIMATRALPRMLRDSFGELTVHQLAHLLDDRSCIAEVEIQTDEPIYPIRYRGRLIFPVGTFVTSLCTPELRIALDRDHIKRVLFGASYYHDVIFDHYVDELYGKRKEYEAQGNPTFAFACKIMLNSLYGKFGQNGQVWDYVREARPDDPLVWIEQETLEDKPVKYRQRLGMIQQQKKEGESDNSFPGLSAHVTSYGRAMLWELFEIAGRENVLYTDTDSMMVTQAGYDRLQAHIDPGILGKLKVEAVVQDATIYGPKDYILDGKAKHKGVRATALKLAWNVWEHEVFRSWDWLLSRGKDGYVIVEHSTKTLYRQSRKGKTSTSGWVTPYSVPEDISN